MKAYKRRIADQLLADKLEAIGGVDRRAQILRQDHFGRSADQM